MPNPVKFDAPMGRDRGQRKRIGGRGPRHGRAALTRADGGSSVSDRHSARAALETVPTHQIRVQPGHLGPFACIEVDSVHCCLYKLSCMCSVDELGSVPRSDLLGSRPGPTAGELAFNQAGTGDERRSRQPPPDLTAALLRLRGFTHGRRALNATMPDLPVRTHTVRLPSRLELLALLDASRIRVPSGSRSTRTPRR